MVLPEKIKFVGRKYTEQFNGREGELAILLNIKFLPLP
jgi:hypothetical protein